MEAGIILIGIVIVAGIISIDTKLSQIIAILMDK
jgi:hypothetical protein